MKGLSLLLMLSIGTYLANADGYPYLTFETTDGAKASVSVSNLTISISGNTLSAGVQSFTLLTLTMGHPRDFSPEIVVGWPSEPGY